MYVQALRHVTIQSCSDNGNTESHLLVRHGSVVSIFQATSDRPRGLDQGERPSSRIQDPASTAERQATRLAGIVYRRVACRRLNDGRADGGWGLREYLCLDLKNFPSSMHYRTKVVDSWTMLYVCISTYRHVDSTYQFHSMYQSSESVLERKLIRLDVRCRYSLSSAECLCGK